MVVFAQVEIFNHETYGILHAGKAFFMVTLYMSDHATPGIANPGFGKLGPLLDKPEDERINCRFRHL